MGIKLSDIPAALLLFVGFWIILSVLYPLGYWAISNSIDFLTDILRGF